MPAFVLVVALPAGVATWRVETAVSSAPADGPQVFRPDAPVLSGRRLAGALVGPAGDGRLVAALADLAGRTPESACLVVSAAGEVVFEDDAAEPVIPASAIKLLTATAVLHHLGPQERLRTTVTVARPPVSGVVPGDLWLVGGGDPLLGTAGYFERFRRQPQLRTSLEELADGVVAAGVRRVDGRVVGDESRYDDRRTVATWERSYVTGNQSGPLSALSVNDGFAAWEPGLVRFDDPPSGAAAVFTELLRERGVVVTGTPGAGHQPAGTSRLAAVDSAPMADVVGEMLRESDNGTAELLLKELGRRVAGEGSTAAGARAVADTMAGLGLSDDGLVVADGSGLDRGNRVTCALLHAVLDRAPADGPMVQGLAVAGDTGTLWRRLDDTPAEGRLRGKTGSIAAVRALAGVIVSPDGVRLDFAQVMNDVVAPAESAALQDELAFVLARYPEAPDEVALGPASYQWPTQFSEPGAG